MLRIAQSTYQEILQHARRSYPEECCGVLLGDASGVVVQAVACANRAATPRTRYDIEPAELIRIQREARGQQLQIAGFYHSHPDAPPVPSATDLAQAYWTGCVYLIAAAGEADGVRAFLLDSEGRLQEQPLEVVAGRGL